MLTVVAPDNFVGNAEASEELGSHLVAIRGTREKFVRLVGTHRLGLAQISQAHQGCTHAALAEKRPGG